MKDSNEDLDSIKKEHEVEEKELKEDHVVDEKIKEETYDTEESELKEKHELEKKELHDKHKIEEKKLHQKHMMEEKRLKSGGSAPHHKTIKKSKPNNTFTILIVIGVIIIALLAFTYLKPMIFPGDSGTSSTGPNNIDTSKTGTVDLDFYVMSQCPYGTQVEDAIAPVLDKLGDSVEFSLYFIGNVKADGFDSLHGEPEVLGDKVQACAIKYEPDKYMDMVVCMNKNARGIPDNWESCAEENGLDVEKVKTCYEGDEGNTLLKESFEAANTIGASGSPTIYLDDELYQSGRDTLSFQRALCQKLNNHPGCADIPICAADTDCKKTGKVGKCINPGKKEATCEFSEPTKINMIVMNDKRCTDCDVTRVLSQLKGMFPGLTVKNLDYSSDEGNKLYSDSKLTVLPALLFDDTIKDDPSYTQIAGYFEPKGDYLSLRIGSSYDPTKEICDNKKDDTGNGKTDCEDDDCSAVWECVKKSEKPEIELFVMSHCPYGTQIEKGMLPVVELLGDKVDFQLKFVNYAMHDMKEIDEQLNQYCINKEYPDKFLSYLKCFLEAGETKSCLDEGGFDTAKLDSCVKETDEEFGITKAYKDKTTWRGNFPSFALHNEDNEKYDVRGSPTLIINGATPSAGRDAASILKAVCFAFDEMPDECNTDMSSEGSPSPGFGFTQGSPATAATDGGCEV